MNDLASEFDCRVADCRLWMPDEAFADGHHLLRDPAGVFSASLPARCWPRRCETSREARDDAGLLARLSIRFSSAARARDRGTTTNAARGVALGSFLFIALVLNTGGMILVDDLRPGIRDPEYGGRVRHYQERAAENPGRPMVMVVGSSCAAMGVRPGSGRRFAVNRSPCSST